MSSASEGPKRRYVATVVEVEGRDEHKIVELPDFELAAWETNEPLAIVGQPLPRVDAREKVTGRAVYTADVGHPGMLYAAFVRAAIPRGRVTELELGAARAVPGVVHVLTAEDLAELPRPPRANGVTLFSRDVSYAGQPLAAVCAETRAAAERAAEAVQVAYEPAAFAVTGDQALASGAPSVRGGAKANVSRSSPVVEARGDVEQGLREAEVIVRRTYRTPCQLHSALEPHGAVAVWEGDDLTVWESTQGVFTVRDDVAGALGMPQASVRVVMEHMGGGFGAKNHAGAHTYVAALLARRTGRAVRCVLDREGEQTDTGHRPPARIDVTLGARRDGALTAIAVRAVVAQGVSGWEASVGKIFHELYACPNVRSEETFAYVNTQAMAAFRGPGHTEGAFALERAMDELARRLGVDPLELRLRNYADRDQEKDRPYSAGSLRKCYEAGAERFGWWSRRARPNPESGSPRKSDSDPHYGKFDSDPHFRVRRGFGVAAQIWPTGGGPPAYATVRLHPDGTADVLTGTQDLGTGARTILAQVAAEALGMRFEDVRVVLGDTERTPYTGNSWGSMTTPSVAPAVRMAAEDARRHLLQAAAEILDCRPEDLVVRNGMIDKRDCSAHVRIADVTRKLGHVMIMGHGSRGPNARGVGLMTFGAHFVEVEVDVETGVVRVVRFVAAHDAGRIINPVLAESQLHGGILQGLGFALFEERVLDERLGLPLNTGLHDYKIPTMADVPRLEAFFVGDADPVANSVGARGLAEPPVIPVAPAIANAVADALGVEPEEIPLTPWRVLALSSRGA
ncbi:MAG TPA: xanthine dehydrogenase family protein molybdopterin-binding subunit [Gemmatimonadaceae bacterium]|nr:xanthine dehydrogenase family protein molybdopterin-binding subunit [Gemmatimonadaceae bacterium]